MEILENSPEAYKDARYKKIDDNTKARFMDSWGKPYYPYHPFILEMESILLQQKYGDKSYMLGEYRNSITFS